MEVPNLFSVKTNYIESPCIHHPASATISGLVIMLHLYFYPAFLKSYLYFPGSSSYVLKKI